MPAASARPQQPGTRADQRRRSERAAEQQERLTQAQQHAVDELLRAAPVIDRLAAAFTAAGHELYLVGGSVRDALLGRLGHDLDLTTSARPDAIEALLRPVADAVWTIGKEFGTVGGRVGDWVVEITTYRADVYRSESRKPEVVFGDTLEGDLVRRDFSVNAMAIRVGGDADALVDPYGGLVDLAARKLRTPATAELSFSDDPLRMLRAARFGSQLGFVPTPDVVAAMVGMADRIDIISAERVRDELVKLLLTDDPSFGLDLLVQTGLAGRFLPELPALRLTRDEHHRHKDVYVHSLTVLEQAIALEKTRGHAPDIVNRLAALLHDIGKPATRAYEANGKVTFHHHDVVGAKLTRKRMKALRFSSDEIEAVSHLVALHLRFHGYSGLQGDLEQGEAGGWTDSAVRRYVRDAGDQLERLHMLTRADCTTRNQAKATRLRQAYDDLEQRIAVLAEEEELASLRPDLDGRAIMTILGIAPGPVVGKAYNYLLEARIEHGPLGTERATELLQQWWAEQEQV